MNEYVAARRKQILEFLKNFVMDRANHEGQMPTAIEGLHFSRWNKGEYSTNCLSEARAALIVNGRKLFRLGDRQVEILAGHSMVNCVDTPTASTLVAVSAEEPFIGISFLLDKKILASLLPDMTAHPRMEGMAALAMPAPLDFMETLLRYVSLLDKPESIPILAPLVARELHYLVLSGPQGGRLRDLYLSGNSGGAILNVINWLKEHFSESFTIEDLAKKTNMSVSSLHRHFKAITGYSPLQYHKRLRLYEAQRLMLADNERADIAAMAVGYESVTQFNREYKRLFGQPPRRDVAMHKNKLL